MVTWQPGMTLETVEKECILQALRFFRGNKSQTAIALGITVKTIDNKLERYGLDAKSEQERIDADKLNRAKQLDRSRGIGFQIQVPVGETEQARVSSARAGVHVQPVVETGPEHNLPVSERKEVQSVLPKHAAAGNQSRRR